MKYKDKRVQPPAWGTRVFLCGCKQETEDDVKLLRPNNQVVCAYHGAGLKGVEITCQRCGKKELKNKNSWRSKYCSQCFDKKFRRWKYQEKKPTRKAERLTEYEREYIESHPWLTIEAMAADLNLKRHVVAEYIKKHKLRRLDSYSKKEIALYRWFRDHKDVAYRG